MESVHSILVSVVSSFKEYVSLTRCFVYRAISTRTQLFVDDDTIAWFYNLNVVFHIGADHLSSDPHETNATPASANDVSRWCQSDNLRLAQCRMTPEMILRVRKDDTTLFSQIDCNFKIGKLDNCIQPPTVIWN